MVASLNSVDSGSMSVPLAKMFPKQSAKNFFRARPSFARVYIPRRAPVAGCSRARRLRSDTVQVRLIPEADDAKLRVPERRLDRLDRRGRVLHPVRQQQDRSLVSGRPQRLDGFAQPVADACPPSGSKSADRAAGVRCGADELLLSASVDIPRRRFRRMRCARAEGDHADPVTGIHAHELNEKRSSVLSPRPSSSGPYPTFPGAPCCPSDQRRS